MSTTTRVHVDRGIEFITVFNEKHLPFHREVRLTEELPKDFIGIKDLYNKGYSKITLKILGNPNIETPIIKVYSDLLGEFSIRLSRKLQSRIVRECKTNVNLVIKRAKQNKAFFDTNESVVF